jgi:hypothetical protein
MTRVAFALLALSLAFAGVALADTPTAPPQQAQPAAAAGHDRHDRTDPQAERMTKALNILEAKGHGNFKDFRADGDNYAATVTSDRGPVTVVIDPDTDQVTRQC